MNGLAAAATTLAPTFIGAPATNPINPPNADVHLANGSSKSINFSSSTKAPGTPKAAVSAKLHKPAPNALRAPSFLILASASGLCNSSHILPPP